MSNAHRATYRIRKQLRLARRFQSTWLRWPSWPRRQELWLHLQLLMDLLSPLNAFLHLSSWSRFLLAEHLYSFSAHASVPARINLPLRLVRTLRRRLRRQCRYPIQCRQRPRRSHHRRVGDSHGPPRSWVHWPCPIPQPARTEDFDLLSARSSCMQLTTKPNLRGFVKLVPPVNLR